MKEVTQLVFSKNNLKSFSQLSVRFLTSFKREFQFYQKYFIKNFENKSGVAFTQLQMYYSR